MKTGFALPSCSYNIVLSKEDLNELIDKGHAVLAVTKTPCTSSRAVWNDEKKTMESIDKKAVPNSLLFYLKEDVADCNKGDYPVQFINIIVEE